MLAPVQLTSDYLPKVVNAAGFSISVPVTKAGVYYIRIASVTSGDYGGPVGGTMAYEAYQTFTTDDIGKVAQIFLPSNKGKLLFNYDLANRSALFTTLFTIMQYNAYGASQGGEIVSKVSCVPITFNR
ncbi:hypothetical protein [Pedobacter cryoconitis]|uniref:Uncharacterized protein n=1 Tax=Pedobacter cryoconitis TaxID=188932 RepID=A0A7X0J515_9SPHI|nr:hypothetical protein [Pedobacter cryoconitis]MBB6501000.1 hypothetical protein [Pedobacter cryoconitis]